MLAGLIGVPTGSALAQRLRLIDHTCDPLICAFGLIASAPFVYLGLVVAPYSTNWCFFFVFFAEVTLNLSWSIVADMLLVSAVAPCWLKKNNFRFDKRSAWIMYAELLPFIVFASRHRCPLILNCRNDGKQRKLKTYKKNFSPTPNLLPNLLYFQRLVCLWRHNNDGRNHWRPTWQLLIDQIKQNLPTQRSCDLCHGLTY